MQVNILNNQLFRDTRTCSPGIPRFGAANADRLTQVLGGASMFVIEPRSAQESVFLPQALAREHGANSPRDLHYRFWS